MDDTTQRRYPKALQHMMAGTYSEYQTYGDWNDRMYRDHKIYVMSPG